MPDAPSRPDVSAIPVPLPTHPVAQHPVAREAVHFDWTAVPDAEQYRLQIAATDAFETIYYDDSVPDSCEVPLHDVLPEASTEFCWRVRAEDVPDERWSPPAHGRIGSSKTDEASDIRVDAPPVPMYPTSGDTVDGRAAAFTWEAVPEASGYRLQIGTTSPLSDPVVDLTVDQMTSLTLFDMLPEDASQLFWRLRALFPNGSEGPWSETAEFGTDVDEMEKMSDTRGTSSGSDVTPTEGAPEAAGPASTGHTSQAMAMTFIVLLVASFLATIALIMYFE